MITLHPPQSPNWRRKLHAACVFLSHIPLQYVSWAVTTPVPLLPSYIINYKHTHTNIYRNMSAVLSGPLQPPANHRAGELASLAATSQVDGIRGLIIQSRLSAASAFPQTGSSLQPRKTNQQQTALIIYLRLSQLWECYIAIFSVYHCGKSFKPR